MKVASIDSLKEYGYERKERKKRCSEDWGQVKVFFKICIKGKINKCVVLAISPYLFHGFKLPLFFQGEFSPINNSQTVLHKCEFSILQCSALKY